MTTLTAPKPSLKPVAAYFFDDGTPTMQKMQEWQALTDEDKAQLSAGILDGTMTY